MRAALRKPASSPTSTPPGKTGFRQRLQAAGGQCPGAVGDALAAFEELADFRMRLEALEFLVRRQVRVLVAKADHEADGNLVVLQVIEEAAAVGRRHPSASRRCARPGRPVLVGLDFPQFLEADAVGLRVGVASSANFSIEELLAEMAAAAFGEEGVFAEQFHAHLEVRAFRAIVQAAHVAGGDAADRAWSSYSTSAPAKPG
jgi:hypothetical protein